MTSAGDADQLRSPAGCVRGQARNHICVATGTVHARGAADTPFLTVTMTVTVWIKIHVYRDTQVPWSAAGVDCVLRKWRPLKVSDPETATPTQLMAVAV